MAASDPPSATHRPVETLHWGVTLRSAPLLRVPALLPLGLVEEAGESEWDPELPSYDSLAEAVANAATRR